MLSGAQRRLLLRRESGGWSRCGGRDGLRNRTWSCRNSSRNRGRSCRLEKEEREGTDMPDQHAHRRKKR